MTYEELQTGFASLLDLPARPADQDIPTRLKQWWAEFRAWPVSEYCAAIKSYRSALPCAVCKAAPRFPLPEQIRAHASKGVLEKIAERRQVGCDHCEDGWIQVVTEGGESVGVRPCPRCRPAERRSA